MIQELYVLVQYLANPIKEQTIKYINSGNVCLFYYHCAVVPMYLHRKLVTLEINGCYYIKIIIKYFYIQTNLGKHWVKQILFGCY